MYIWKKINHRDLKNIGNHSSDGFNSDIWIGKIKKKFLRVFFFIEKKNLWNIIFPQPQFLGFY